jgi:predicted RNA binding protein YcfA (HicA-like mRNA interferase family)
VNKRKLFERVANNPRDVRFSDLLTLIDAFGFQYNRTTGSHHIYDYPTAPLVLNLQPDANGRAKPYQVRKFLRDIARHGLLMEDEA